MTGPRIITVRRVIGTHGGGSSQPLRVETDSGPFVLKLLHGAEGPRALAAEWIVGGLARVLGFAVPEITLLDFDPALAESIVDQEIRETAQRGAGLCLGLRELEGARPARADEIAAAPDDFALPLMWLDVLVDNPDRRAANPNLLTFRGALVPIDHGAALPFHHDWRVTEDLPRAELEPRADHVFFNRYVRGTSKPSLSSITIAVLDEVCGATPEVWLGDIALGSAARQRAAYAAYLKKRLVALMKG